MSSYRMKYKIGNTQYHIPVTDDMAGFGGGVPVGIILPYSSNSQDPPEGFLFCDGSAVSRAMYPDLFLVIGTIYGSGDGSTTFNLPNLVGGEFLEGASSAGTSKSAGLPNITGSGGRSVSGGGGFTGAFASSSASSTISGGSSAPIWSVCFDASDSNAIYGNSTTVQPKSVTVRYVIKAFDGQSQSSALIDITQYASALNQKLTENDIYGNNFTIIYPNNGSEQNPANITKNMRYVESNPFPGYYVKCIVEIQHNGNWGNPEWYDDPNYDTGVRANQLNDDDIIIQTGVSYLCICGDHSGTPLPNVSSQIATAPARVKVWKIGKIPSQSS